MKAFKIGEGINLEHELKDFIKKCDQARRATYVFKKNAQGEWLCAVDNSYGTDLINR